MAKENIYELKATALFNEYVSKGRMLDNDDSKNIFLIAFALGLEIGFKDSRKIFDEFSGKTESLLKS